MTETYFESDFAACCPTKCRLVIRQSEPDTQRSTDIDTIHERIKARSASLGAAATARLAGTRLTAIHAELTPARRR